MAVKAVKRRTRAQLTKSGIGFNELREHRYGDRPFSLQTIGLGGIHIRHLVEKMRRDKKSSHEIRKAIRILSQQEAIVNNPLLDITRRNPHLVLFDRHGERFSLSWKEQKNQFWLFTIQRSRTQYQTTSPYSVSWERKQEQDSIDKLREELGIHPGEALLREFVWRKRNQIKKGKKVFLVVNENETKKNYELYISRYFKPTNREAEWKEDSLPHFIYIIRNVRVSLERNTHKANQVYELDMNRKRVKKLLED